VRFLFPVEFGLLPAEPALGLRDLHAFASTQPDQVALELRDHGENVEQKSADGVGGVVDRPSQATRRLIHRAPGPQQGAASYELLADPHRTQLGRTAARPSVRVQRAGTRATDDTASRERVAEAG
jgi:hypothetical protein